MSEVATSDLLERARDAARRHAWPEAYEAFTAAARDQPLEPADLDGLAKSAWWTGRPGESIEAHERAYAALVERGNRDGAAFVALTLRREYTSKLAGSVAKGWLKRAERLVDEDSDSVSHGYLALAHGSLAWQRGELDDALSHMERGVEVGRRLGDRDLLGWADMYRGMVLVDLGRVEEGWLALEDVAASAVGGELGAYTTGAVFCNVISVCRDLADYGRASEWADAAKRWCERQSISGFPGVCRVHRAEVLRLLGSWAEAEEEVTRACDELREFSPVHAGAAFHELGEVRLRKGDLEGAEEAFRQAEAFRETPQPGRALLLLAQGRPQAAAASIAGALEEEEWNRLNRARLLPAQAEIARITGDVETARAAAEELTSIAESVGTSAIAAQAESAHGIVGLLDGDTDEAIHRFRRARQLWREVDAPHEVATVGLLLGEAYLAAGELEAARLEIGGAREFLVRLGASPAIARADDLLGRIEAAEAPAGPARRTFLFSDIVGSTQLVEAIGDEAWVGLRRWHDEALRRCFAEHGGEEVDHAGDGFFVAFPDPSAALECAVEIQQSLAEHRRDHGFAPRVRIGVHAADAVAEVGDYTGRGVHEAARIGAMAEGDEILASAETVEGIESLEISEPREVELKGITAPVQVVTVRWRSG